MKTLLLLVVVFGTAFARLFYAPTMWSTSSKLKDYEHYANGDRAPDIHSEFVDQILKLHNEIRANVKPAAVNMQKVYWDADLAYIAGKAARKCEYGTEGAQRNKINVYGLFRPDYNTWRVPLKTYDEIVNPIKAVNAWHNESKNFKWCTFSTGARNYTNMVSAYVTRVGCGMNQCTNTQTGVVEANVWCLYGSKTTDDTNWPYVAGEERGSQCANKTAEGLCDCDGKFCYNDGELQGDCSCKCGKMSVAHNNDPSRNCKMECPVQDDIAYGSDCYTSLLQGDCSNREWIQNYRCPLTCNTCSVYQDMWDKTDAAYNVNYMT